MNTARAYNYVTQALDHVAELEKSLTIPQDDLGRWVSLKRNLESAQTDLAPVKE